MVEEKWRSNPQYDPFPNIPSEFNKVMHVMDNFENIVGMLKEHQEVTNKGKIMVVEEDVEVTLEERPTYQPPKKLRIYCRRRKATKEEKSLTTLITFEGPKAYHPKSTMPPPPT